MAETVDFERLIPNLYLLNEIQIGDPSQPTAPQQWTTRAGQLSPYYVSARGVTGFSRSKRLPVEEQLVTREMTAAAIGDALARQGLPWDHLYGVRQAGTPLAALVAGGMRRSLLWGRIGVKNHGITTTPVEGNYVPGDSLALVDNVLTTGGSADEEATMLEGLGFHIATLGVLVDRSEGGVGNLKARTPSIPVASAITMPDVVQILNDAGLLHPEQVELAEAYYQSRALPGTTDTA